MGILKFLSVFEVIFEDAAAREIAAKTNLLSIIFTLLSSKNPAVNYRCATTLYAQVPYLSYVMKIYLSTVRCSSHSSD